MKKILFSLIIVLAAFSVKAQIADWYVDANHATGSHTGTSWDDAFGNIQEAINAANNGDVIFVKGEPGGMIYTPDLSISDNFDFLHKTVEIYGGFEGWEDFLFERTNWRFFESVISGINNYGYAIDLNGSNVHMDGFTIEDNHSLHSLFTMGGVAVQVLSNLIIRNNDNSNEGLFICESASPYDNNIVFINCQITCNTNGTGMLFSCYNVGLQFYNVTIANNDNPFSLWVNNSFVYLYNTILWSSGEVNSVYSVYQSEIHAFNSDIQNADYYFESDIINNEGGNIDKNPEFMNPVCDYLSDYHLDPISECIDAGKDDYYNVIANSFIPWWWNRDLDSYQRFVNYRGVLSDSIDMGCCEYGAEPFYTPQFIQARKNKRQPNVLSNKLSIPTLLQAGAFFPFTANTIDKEHYLVRIYSLSGVLVSSQTTALYSNTVSAPQKAGVYILLVSKEDGSIVSRQKIIVKQ